MSKKVLKFNMEYLPIAVRLANEQGIEVILDGDTIYFIDPKQIYRRVLNKTRYRGYGRPRNNDYDKKGGDI